MASGDQGAGGRSVLIKIQNNPRPDDGFGGQDNTEAAWVDKYEPWAKMRQASGREVFANREKNARALYVFEFDFPLAVTILASDRILVGTRAFDIRRIENVGQRNMLMKVTAEEGVPD